MLGILVTAEGIIEGCSGFVNLSTTSFVRSAIYVKMAKEAMKRGTDVVKKDKITKQLKEIEDELGTLRSVICSATEF